MCIIFGGMKTESQKNLVKALGVSRYRVDMVSGEIGYLPPGEGRVIKKVNGSKPRGGYVQYKIYKGRGKGSPVLAYWHDLVWIMLFGPYPDDKRVVFKDGDLNNRTPQNLELKDRRKRPVSGKRRVRFDEINDIKFYVRGNVKPSKIASELDLSPASVARTIKKIKKGEKLKYENGNYVPSPNNKVLFGENRKIQ